MAKIMSQIVITCLILNSILMLLLPFAACSSSSTSLKAAVLCKELNQWNCYFAKNTGNFCSSNKDEGKTETRWYYDKGHCRKFAYKGCNGNRNRFCTKDSCMKRCQED